MPPPADQPAPSNPGKKAQGHAIQPPRGTRDFYPIEMARRLWLEDKWRRTAVRHGFDEIDGPTFEHLDLYTVKSGEGIVNELFSFTRAGGETPFALRPEFTPTLARMVATKANALPKPIKWFSIGPYFRAERPQRGRLREFLQWNVDVLGDPSPEADAEAIACCVDALHSVGFEPGDLRLRLSSRRALDVVFGAFDIPPDIHWHVTQLIDAMPKLNETQQRQSAQDIGLSAPAWEGIKRALKSPLNFDSADLALPQQPTPFLSSDTTLEELARWPAEQPITELRSLTRLLDGMGIGSWCNCDLSIVRGLAYYTGTVFEVHETTGAERAIAGGGRYDNLVELFGGPPTPAVGFAMGDVVLSLVLQDKGLMPSDANIARDLGLAPDAFVFAASDEADAQALRPLLAHLRRLGLHARRSYKTTRNVGKLLQDADKCGARFAVILESPTSAKVKNLGAATRTDGEPVTGADVEALAQAIAAKIPAK